MIYKNTDSRCAQIMEDARLGGYDSGNSKNVLTAYCPICGEIYIDCLYKNIITGDIVGCDCCVQREEI